MSNKSISHEHLNKEIKLGTVRFVTGATLYLIGKEVERQTGKSTIAVPLLLFGGVVAPLLLKSISKTEL